CSSALLTLHSFPTRRSSDLVVRHLPHELLAVEAPHAVIADATNGCRDIPDIRLRRHRLHRRLDVLILELVPHVLVEHGAQIFPTVGHLLLLLAVAGLALLSALVP